MTTTITDRAGSLRDHVAAAVDDGKQAAKDRELELRAGSVERPHEPGAQPPRAP